jgi:xylulokinase
MSSNAAGEAARLRDAMGGPERMTALSGSDSPARFSGAVLMRRAEREPELYAGSSVIHLISSFLASALSGRSDAPIDWGNGAGTSLMDWSGRCWSDQLIGGASEALPGRASALRARLPGLVHPLTRVGQVARYFSERYGIPPTAVVIAGSGDNPQTKVLSPGDLLSLGTSFVLMAEGSKPHTSANAMYDGLGRPFLFGCRTNGALVWEAVRLSHALAADDFPAADAALASMPPGSILRILQREPESFPASPILDAGGKQGFAEDYAGTVDSTLGLVYLGSRRFAAGDAGVAAGGLMAVTGGAAMSDGVLRRVAAIWGRPVSRIDEAGAAAGAAVAAAAALVPEARREEYAARAAIAVSGRGKVVEPDREALAAYHGEGGYLRRLERLFESLAAGPL